LGPSSLPVVVVRLTKDMLTEQLLCWSGMTGTEHKTTSSSSEEIYESGMDLQCLAEVFCKEIVVSIMK